MADELTIQDLQNIKLLELYEKHFKEVVAFSDEAKEADWFVKNVGPVILKNKKELGMYEDGLYNSYERLLILNKWISLSIRPDDDFIDLFKNCFTYIFQLSDNIEIWKKIKAKLQAILAFEDRDEIKAKIRKVLLANTEILTKKEIIFDNKKYSGTVGNWLQDYNRVVGTGKVDKLKKENYLINSDNIKGLDVGDRKRISFLINLYERLKLSSLTPEGLEDPVSVVVNGRLATLREGHFEPIDPRIINALKKMREKGVIKEIPSTLIGEQISTERISTSQSLQPPSPTSPPTPAPSSPISAPGGATASGAGASGATADGATASRAGATPAPTEKLQKQFQSFLSTPLITASFEKQESIQQETGKDLKHLKNKFYHSINEKEIENVLAALFAVCENGQLREMFVKDDRFIKFWGDYLARQNFALQNLGGQADLNQQMADGATGRGVLQYARTDADQFKNDPANEKYLAMFFKYILEKRLKMNDEEAVLVGAVVGNLARKAGEL
ncbi:MAG: hypothetical protein ABIJ91_03520, partial [Candidatus Kuenenbacteria bacterium]